jgi:flagellar hook assembly protein FlgD
MIVTATYRPTAAFGGGGDGEKSDESPIQFDKFDGVVRPLDGQQLEVKYKIAERVQMRMTVYGRRGEIVKDLYSGDADAGILDVKWDGRNNDGVEMPAGLYIFETIRGSERERKKFVLVK